MTEGDLDGVGGHGRLAKRCRLLAAGSTGAGRVIQGRIAFAPGNAPKSGFERFFVAKSSVEEIQEVAALQAVISGAG